MQVSLETAEGLERRLSIIIPSEEINSEIDNRLNSLINKVKISGFRPGKVPLSVVKQRFGKQVHAEVLEAAVQKNFSRAIEQERLRPASVPKISHSSGSNTQDDIRFTATFEVYPEFEIQNIEDMVINKPIVEITETDVNNVIERLRKQKVTWEQYDGAVQNEDKVTIDFTGTVNGEKFAGGEATQQEVVVGAKQMIPGFEDNLLNTSAGETVDFDITFPEDYQGQEMAGKQAHFLVTVNKVERAIVPEIDNDFIKSLGIDDAIDGVDGLRRKVRQNMQRELEQAIKHRVKNNVLDELLEKNPIELPTALVVMESGRLAEQMNAKLKSMSNNSTISKTFTADQFEQQGKKRVALGMIFDEIVKKNKLHASADKVKAAIENIAASYDESDKVINWYYNNRDELKGIESLVVEDEVIDWVLAGAQVGETSTTFDELVK